jgi:hypothetical protein
MKQNKKGALLLGASIVGFAYAIGYWESFLNIIKDVGKRSGSELNDHRLKAVGFVAAESRVEAKAS